MTQGESKAETLEEICMRMKSAGNLSGPQAQQKMRGLTESVYLAMAMILARGRAACDATPVYEQAFVEFGRFMAKWPEGQEYWPKEGNPNAVRPL